MTWCTDMAYILTPLRTKCRFSSTAHTYKAYSYAFTHHSAYSNWQSEQFQRLLSRTGCGTRISLGEIWTKSSDLLIVAIPCWRGWDGTNIGLCSPCGCWRGWYTGPAWFGDWPPDHNVPDCGVYPEKKYTRSIRQALAWICSLSLFFHDAPLYNSCPALCS